MEGWMGMIYINIIFFARRGAEDVKIKHGDTIHSS